MAQPNKNKKNKRMPSYSADSMAVHLVSGLLLIALGALIFMSVDLNMAGDVFNGLRNVSYALTGALAMLLPLFPIWGGALVIFSMQRKAPVRPFLLALGLYVLLLACGNLLTFTGSPRQSLMDFYRVSSYDPGSFATYLAKAGSSGTQRHIGGGYLGMLPAWPLWSVMGAVPAAIVCILLAIVDVLFLVRFDARTVLLGLKNRQDARQERSARQQAELRQQELAWQQQAAYAAQQQAYAAQPYPAQQPAPQQSAPYPGQQPAAKPARRAAKADPAIGFPPTDEEVNGIRRPLRSLKDLLFGAHDEDIAPAPRSNRRRPFSDTENDDWMSAQPVQQPAPEQPARSRRPARARQETEPVFPSEQRAAQQYTAPIDMPPAENDWQEAPVQQPAYSQPSFSQPLQPVQQTVSQPSQKLPKVKQTADAPRASASWQDQINEKLNAFEVQDAPSPARTAAKRPWDENGGTRRTATWQHAEDEVQKPARSPRSQTSGSVQKPKASWTDDSQRPPWEDPIDTPAEAVVPVAQQDTPRGGWTPELDLAPTKAGQATFGDLYAEEAPVEIPYVYPDLDLVKLPEAPVDQNPEEDAMRAQRLEETLSSFKVAAKVRHITHGPAITRFELELAAGIKVSKVTDLAQNIAMNMEVKSVRIEAPIPGKSLVGIEVPNRKTATVTLREVMESDPMRGAKSSLAVALGKDLAGTPIVCDLARMPHLLIAGATGSGKSVCINTMITSLLYRCSPKEVRLILVDPKVVELQCYNGLPHLLLPVVSDPHKAAGALAWAVGEMMDRYKKFQIKGCRAIDGYNANLEDGEEFMPRIVIIIDELADLMMTCKRDVEDHICRLAQLARAAGIHLVVATQRPSVDVITGLIKANIPSRIAFKVSSFIDSRTILDKMGAEQLLGWGDMLYQPTGEFTPIRIQGCFLSDAEVNRVTDFIRSNYPEGYVPYDPNVTDQIDKLVDSDDAMGGLDFPEQGETSSGDGSLLSQCIEMAVNDGQVSTSLIQRRLKIGYARAGRLVDEMEKRGIVSQKDGAKPRMCLLSREEYERMKEDGDLDG